MSKTQAQKGGARIHNSVAGAIFYLLGGSIIWAIHFLLVYGAQSTLCALAINSGGREPTSLVSETIVAATIVALLLQNILLICPKRVAKLLRFQPSDKPDLEFAMSVGRLLTVLSMLGVAWAGIGAILLDPCNHLR